MLKVQNLSVGFQIDPTNIKSVIDNVSFTAVPSEILVIMGPSGCGKTTILNAIANNLDGNAICEGSIKLGKYTRNEIAMVFQEPRLLPWKNVYENIVLGLEIKNKKLINQNDINQILSLVILKDFQDYLPHKLSLGMKQRVNFARALITKPKILLLDEPFSSLDRETKTILKKKLKKLTETEGLVTILVTHQESDLDIADSVVRMSKSPSIILSVESFHNGK